MFFFVMGLPGYFSDWCDAVAARLAGHAPGPTGIIHANTLAELPLVAMRSGTSRAVIASRQPGGSLRRALVEAGRSFVVALDDPGMALVDLVLGHGATLAAATQAVASSSAALIGYRSAPGALILHSGRDWPQPTATAAAMARHLQIAVDDSEIGELVADLAAGDATRPRHDAVAWWNGLGAADREMVTGALLPYVEHEASSRSPSVTWTHGLFFIGDRPSERATGPIDITGRARCLIEGPHIVLPPGSWSLSLTLLFSRAAAEHEFLVIISTDHPLTHGKIRAQREGSAEISLDFALDDATEHPITIRIGSVRAAFDGAIAVVAATLAPAAAADAPPAALVLAGA